MYRLRECLNGRDKQETIALFDLQSEPSLINPLPESWRETAEPLMERMRVTTALRVLSETTLDARVCVINEQDRCEDDVEIFVFIP